MTPSSQRIISTPNKRGRILNLPPTPGRTGNQFSQPTSFAASSTKKSKPSGLPMVSFIL